MGLKTTMEGFVALFLTEREHKRPFERFYNCHLKQQEFFADIASSHAFNRLGKLLLRDTFHYTTVKKLHSISNLNDGYQSWYENERVCISGCCDSLKVMCKVVQGCDNKAL